MGSARTFASKVALASPDGGLVPTKSTAAEALERTWSDAAAVATAATAPIAGVTTDAVAARDDSRTVKKVPPPASPVVAELMGA